MSVKSGISPKHRFRVFENEVLMRIFAPKEGGSKMRMQDNSS
jgi:hypothetical protein